MQIESIRLKNFRAFKDITLRDIRAELDEAQLDAFHGTVSLPFAAGENRKVAVKIVDDRGIESLKIVNLEE